MKRFIITKEWSDSLLKEMYYIKEIKKDGFEAIMIAYPHRSQVDLWSEIQRKHYKNMVTIDDQSINDEKDTLPPNDSPAPVIL